MGLSEIKGLGCFDTLADIMAPAMEIAQDEEAKELFSLNKERPEGMTQEEFGIKLMGEKFPGVIKRHKKAFASILAAMEGVSEEEYVESLTFPKLVSGIYSLMNDASFRSFLS